MKPFHLSFLAILLPFMTIANNPQELVDGNNTFAFKLYHQAFINVDEKGTEAAAATAVVMKMMAIRVPDKPKIFDADHPFIFCIKDNTTGSILFMGKIMNPKGKSF